MDLTDVAVNRYAGPPTKVGVISAGGVVSFWPDTNIEQAGMGDERVEAARMLG